MKTLLTRLAALAVLVLCSTSAHAVQYPPGPGGAFPDTLTIANIQNPLAVPFLAAPDTVYGIQGIITGFDEKPTGFGFYIQEASGNPFTGILVFTGGANKRSEAPGNYNLGDLVVVYGKKQEFGNGSEIEGFDNTTSTNDVIVRRLSTGNPLPPFFVGTTTQLQELPSNTFAEQYEGMLVRINGPLRVARTSLTGGLGQNNSFILVSDLATADSVFIDGNTLTTYAPPAVGTIVDQVQGCYDQRSRGYRIQLRDGNDIVVATPPNVVDAYAVGPTTVRVTFDRNVTAATATDVNNYVLSSFGTVDAAVMDGSSAAVLTITNGLGNGAPETVTIENIAGLANGLVMGSPQSRTFLNGVLSCVEVQAADPDTLTDPAGCRDKSRYAGGGNGQTGIGIPGTRMTFRGTVTGVMGNLVFLSDAAQPVRGAVAVFAPSSALVRNREYIIAGQVQEFFGITEVVNTVYVQDLGAVTPISPRVSTVAEIDLIDCDQVNAQIDGEDLECLLVRVPLVRVVQRFNPLPTNGFHVTPLRPESGDTLFVQNLNSVLSPFTHPPLGTIYNITGVVNFNNSFRVAPRDYADIEVATLGVDPNPGRVTFSAYPNPGVRSRLVFSLPQESDVELGVYDLSGREVAQVIRGRLPAGEYSRNWDGSKVGPGVYFYRLKVNGEVFSARTVRLGQ